ncbi:MAG: hypothetical protein L3K18_05500 [Thermoplasmata archaeon]|nr:hypothetical protein [Thermoplasmata archaeon]MCI4356581.1 hypothetical protein [Thermoplasmata archaeon]
MTSGLDEAVGIALLLATIGFSAASVLLLQRGRSGESVMDGMVQLVFLPEKRRAYLWIMSVEGSLFVLSGIVLGVFLLTGWPLDLGLLAFVLLFLAAIAMMSWRTVLGLRPTVLTEEQKETVRRELPNSLSGLAFIPLQGEEPSDPSSRRLFVVSVEPSPEGDPGVRRSRRSRRGGAAGLEPTGSELLGGR